MDPSDHYADPFGEALSHSSQRVTQLTSLVAAAAEVAIRLKAARTARQAAQDQQARRALDDRERAARSQARTRWAPAHDARWLAQSDLLQAARIWGAAAPWAATDPAAASAVRKSEERLRTLHPFAMARYDRLRTDGASPLDAMREAAPLFGLGPHARPAPTRTPLAIGTPVADAAPEPEIADGTSSQPAPEPDPYQDAEHHGRRIAERLQAQALDLRGAELSPDEMATALEQATSLPAEVIARLAQARSEERAAEGAQRARAADLGHASTARSGRGRVQDLTAARRDTAVADTAGAYASSHRTAAQLAAESFPHTAADGIRAAITGRLHQPERSPVRTAAITDTRRSRYPTGQAGSGDAGLLRRSLRCERAGCQAGCACGDRGHLGRRRRHGASRDREHCRARRRGLVGTDGGRGSPRGPAAVPARGGTAGLQDPRR